jgi:hypothetical protein
MDGRTLMSNNGDLQPTEVGVMKQQNGVTSFQYKGSTGDYNCHKTNINEELTIATGQLRPVKVHITVVW